MGGEKLLEQNLGRKIIDPGTPGSSDLSRPTARLVGRQELALQHDLDPHGAKMLGEQVAPPGRRTGGAVGACGQSNNNASGRDAQGCIRDQLRRRRHTLTDDDLERRYDPRAVVTDRQANATSTRINSKIAHGPLYAAPGGEPGSGRTLGTGDGGSYEWLWRRRATLCRELRAGGP